MLPFMVVKLHILCRNSANSFLTDNNYYRKLLYYQINYINLLTD